MQRFPNITALLALVTLSAVTCAEQLKIPAIDTVEIGRHRELCVDVISLSWSRIRFLGRIG